MDIGMSAEARAHIAEALEELLAETYTLYLKTQNAHWNYTGPGFYQIHILLESQYSEMAEAIDEIAERIRALGFFAKGSFSQFQTKSKLPLSEDLSPGELLEDLITCNEEVAKTARRVTKGSDEHGDGATSDLLGRRLAAHEKNLWMLRSSL